MSHAPKGIALRSLATFVLKVQLWVKQLDRRLVVELWLFPDGSRNLEISTKAAPSETFQVTPAAGEATQVAALARQPRATVVSSDGDVARVMAGRNPQRSLTEPSETRSVDRITERRH